ncbi:hypothetical protein VB636_00685 [Paracoccus sp. APAP_BH8]|uniref:hypothetical protein n=1 Tax=Paracoccus sp. APAP_BH8 TaxID=3110237 RepID=UPI002FD7F9ED
MLCPKADRPSPDFANRVREEALARKLILLTRPQAFLLGRAIQAYLGFAYEDRIHLNTLLP